MLCISGSKTLGLESIDDNFEHFFGKQLRLKLLNKEQCHWLLETAAIFSQLLTLNYPSSSAFSFKIIFTSAFYGFQKKPFSLPVSGLIAVIRAAALAITYDKWALRNNNDAACAYVENTAIGTNINRYMQLSFEINVIHIHLFFE